MAAAPPVHILLGISRILAAVLAVAHAAALTVIFNVALPAWAKLFAASVIATSCVWSIAHAALLRTSRAIVELEVGEGGRASYRDRTGMWQRAQILGSSFVAPWLTVLNLRADGSGETRHAVILADNVDADAFRRMRVLLRWSGPTAGPSSKPSNSRG